MREKTKRQREKEIERHYERETETESEAVEAERRERVGDTSWRLRTHSSRDRAVTGGIYVSVCAGKRKKERKSEKERNILCVR